MHIFRQISQNKKNTIRRGQISTEFSNKQHWCQIIQDFSSFCEKNIKNWCAVLKTEAKNAWFWPFGLKKAGILAIKIPPGGQTIIFSKIRFEHFFTSIKSQLCAKRQKIWSQDFELWCEGHTHGHTWMHRLRRLTCRETKKYVCRVIVMSLTAVIWWVLK